MSAGRARTDGAAEEQAALTMDEVSTLLFGMRLGGSSSRWDMRDALTVAGSDTRFLNKIVDLLDFAVRHCDLESYLNAKRAEEERDRASIERWESRKRAAFVERMKQAKATKRAERAATGAASAGPQSVSLRPLEDMRCDHHG